MVVAVGRVLGPFDFEGNAGTPHLCFDLNFLGVFPACGSTAMVDLSGFDATTLPGGLQPERPGGTWVTVASEIYGIWDGTEIEVTDAQPLDRDPLPESPCEPPASGWPGNGHDWEADRDRLGDYVYDRPGEYATYWIATNGQDPIEMDHQVVVVNTVLNATAAEAALEAVYGGNLCVVEVDYSWNELSDLPLEINTLHEGANADFDYARNRVIVHPLTPDPVFVDLVEPYGDKVILEPWIRRAEGVLE
jgi:hypothetical protein